MEKIKMIAVDMDGTFLNSQNDYDRDRFEVLYAQMIERGIKFVVASGNQYYQLKSFFKGKDHQISYVAENGALVIMEGEELSCGQMDMDLVYKIVEFLDQKPSINYLVSGRKSAYMKNTVAQKFKDIAAIYNHELTGLDEFNNFNDKIFKFALIIPKEETLEIVEHLETRFGNKVSVVSSGHGSIDVIIPGLHKANGLSLLQNKLNISSDEIMAFGDGGNDLEMLKHVKYSYAVNNAPEHVKEASNFMAPSNNDDGVLDVIERYLDTGQFE